MTPFEKNFRMKSIFYSKRLDFGLYIRYHPKDWLRTFWDHPEADAIWYEIGPLAFFRAGFLTWEETGADWIGLKIPFLYWPLRWLHQMTFPDHPDYNGGGY